MKCPTCGTEIQPGQKHCPSCGTVQKEDRPWGNPTAPAAAMENRDISKAELCRNYAADRTRKNIRGAAILCYICAVVTADLMPGPAGEATEDIHDRSLCATVPGWRTIQN